MHLGGTYGCTFKCYGSTLADIMWQTAAWLYKEKAKTLVVHVVLLAVLCAHLVVGWSGRNSK